MDIEFEIGELIEQADEMPIGDSKIALLDQAIKLATSHQIRTLEFEAKVLYSEAAIEARREKYFLVHFPWILSYAKEKPEEVDMEHIIWLYSMAIYTLIEHPNIPLSKIEEVISSFEELGKETGIPHIEVLADRIAHQVHLGKINEAGKTFQEILAILTQGRRKKNQSWARYISGYYLEKTGNLEQAFELLNPFLTHEIKNEEFNLLAKTLMLIPLLQLGEYEKAKEHFHFCLAKIPIHAEEAPCLGDLIAYQAVTGDWEKAIHLFEKTLLTLEGVHAEFGYCAFIRGVIHLLKRIPKDHETLSLRIPSWHPTYREDGKYVISELLNYFTDLRTSILSAIDQRNGNTFFLDYHVRWDRLADEIQLNS